MVMRVFSVHHGRHPLLEIERISGQVGGLGSALMAYPSVSGVAVLSTCNRVELLIDSSNGADELLELVNSHFEQAPAWDWYVGEAAMEHITRVAAGLESMVVGEREIAGQVRRALREAQDAGTMSATLTMVMEEALKTSREVANLTTLEGTGRSVVTHGLALLGYRDWQDAQVLIVGTGSYAGAVVAELRRLGARNIQVHSVSGRGSEFAASHDITEATDFQTAVRDAELIITCRGQGALITPEMVHAGQHLLDLSLVRDVEPAVAEVPGVTVVDLSVIQASLAERIEIDTAAAEALVEQGVHRSVTKLRARIVDPAVTRLRTTTMQLVDEELERLPDRELTRDDVARALRHLATRLLHVPSARARQAAEEGRTEEYLGALREIYGVDDVIDPDPAICRCPVTGATLSSE